MARIEILAPRDVIRPKPHNPVEASYTVFESQGATFLQITTYGSPERRDLGLASQIVQFGPEGIATLRGILAKLP